MTGLGLGGEWATGTLSRRELACTGSRQRSGHHAVGFWMGLCWPLRLVFLGARRTLGLALLFLVGVIPAFFVPIQSRLHDALTLARARAGQLSAMRVAPVAHSPPSPSLS